MKLENVEEPKEIKKGSTFKKILLIFLLLLVLFYLYIRFGEPNRLIVKEYAIVDNNLPYSFHGMKIVHFSDILYGTTLNEKNLEKVVEQINSLKPDVVLFTGDLLNSSIKLNEESKNRLKEILKNIEATYKKYAVVGDNDYIDKNIFNDIMESAGFFILNNKNDFLYYGGNDPLLFIGTNSLLEKEYDLKTAYTSNEDITSVYKIWLSHEPIILDELEKENITPNLIFTGHTLNGLMKTPFRGTLLKQQGVNHYLNNVYKEENTSMYISSGLGTYKYSVRFLNPPSINLYRLYQY